MPSVVSGSSSYKGFTNEATKTKVIYKPFKFDVESNDSGKFEIKQNVPPVLNITSPLGTIAISSLESRSAVLDVIEALNDTANWPVQSGGANQPVYKYELDAAGTFTLDITSKPVGGPLDFVTVSINGSMAGNKNDMLALLTQPDVTTLITYIGERLNSLIASKALIDSWNSSH